MHDSSFSVVTSIPYSQSAYGLITLTDVPTVIKAQLQQKGIHNLHNGHPWSTVPLGTTGHLLYYIRTPCQGWEMYHAYLIHRKKHKLLVKMRRQRSMSQMKIYDKTPENKLHKMAQAIYHIQT